MTESEKKEEEKKEKPSIVSWAERQQKWLDDNLGTIGSILGHTLLGPVKFFGNIFTGNFSEVLSMDTLKWLGSTGLVVGAGWGISSLLKGNKDSSSGDTLTGITSAATGLCTKDVVPNLLSKGTNSANSEETNSNNNVSKTLSNTGAKNVNPEEEENQKRSKAQQTR